MRRALTTVNSGSRARNASAATVLLSASSTIPLFRPIAPSQILHARPPAAPRALQCRRAHNLAWERALCDKRGKYGFDADTHGSRLLDSLGSTSVHKAW